MSLSFNIKPTSTIKVRLGIQNGGLAHKFFCNECYRYMSRFVPGGTKSSLNQNVVLAIDGSSITYCSPYAHYQYVGKLYVDPKYKKGAFYNADYGYWSRPGITKMSTNENLKYHTSGTGAFWDKRMWSSKGREVVKSVQRYVDRGCK